MLALQSPYPFFVDREGDPLDGGSLYIGTVALNPVTNPVPVYWDAGATQLAAQPIRTINGLPVRNGTPAQVFIASAYSLAAYDSRGRLRFYAPDSSYLDGGSGAPTSALALKPETQVVAADGQTVFVINTFTYVPGTGSLAVFVDGLLVNDYAQTSPISITFNTPGLSAGQEITFLGGAMVNFGVDSAQVAFQLNGAGSVVRTVQSKLSDIISIKDKGAVGGNATADTAAFLAAFTDLAPGGALYIPKGTYLVNASLAWPPGVKIYGDGRSVSIIKKVFNGDLFSSIGGYAEANDIRFDGNGANFTGRVLYFSAPSTPAQIFTKCDIVNGALNSVEFVPNAGASCRFKHCDIWCTTLTNPGIQMPDDIGGSFFGLNRKFIDINTGGGVLMDLNGADDTYVLDSFFNSLQFNKAAGSGLLWCSGNRFATLGAAQTFNGAGLIIANNNLAGNVTITPNSTGVWYDNNSAGTVTWNPSSPTFGSVSFPKQAFASAWSQVSGTGPALGNGTLLMEYSRQGMTCTVTLYFVYGSTSTPGDGTNAWTFTLPYRASQGINQQSALVGVQDATGAIYPMNISVGAGQATMKLGAAQSVRAGYPFAWAAGAAIKTTFEYTVDA